MLFVLNAKVRRQSQRCCRRPRFVSQMEGSLQSECPDPAVLRTREQDIFAWLKFLKAAHRRASIESVLGYLHALEKEGKNTDSVRASLRWFFKTAAIQRGEERADSPAPPIHEHVIDLERQDKGGPPWEQLLVTVIRRKHLQWRTEETYRGWAHRFVSWLRGRPLEEAGASDIRGFLDHLAVDRKVSASTQKQALNALVFLQREALGRDPGDFSGYRPGRSGKRIPAVLSQRECQTLFSQLTGSGYPDGTGTARPLGCRDHDDLHPCA